MDTKRERVAKAIADAHHGQIVSWDDMADAAIKAYEEEERDLVEEVAMAITKSGAPINSTGIRHAKAAIAALRKGAPERLREVDFLIDTKTHSSAIWLDHREEILDAVLGSES